MSTDERIQKARRRVAANPEDREVKATLGSELRRSGMVDAAFAVLEEAGAIPRRLLGELRRPDRPWPWNEASPTANAWRKQLVNAAREDRLSAETYDTEAWSGRENMGDFVSVFGPAGECEACGQAVNLDEGGNLTSHDSPDGILILPCPGSGSQPTWAPIGGGS